MVDERIDNSFGGVIDGKVGDKDRDVTTISSAVAYTFLVLLYHC